MRLLIALAAILVFAAGPAHAADSGDAAPPRMSGWIETSIAKIEAEATSDAAMVPEIPGAIAREWRSFDGGGSAVGVLGDLVWVVLAAAVALLAEIGAGRALSRRVRRRIALREDGARLIDVLALLVYDVVGLAVFVVVFDAARHHFLPAMGVTLGLAMFAANVLVRWRVVAVISHAIFRPHEPAARLIDLADGLSRHLARFISGAVLAVIALVGFARYGLMDEDSGAAHVIGLIVAVVICGLYSLIIVHARAAGEALIRGRRKSGMIAVVRTAIASVWVPIGLTLVAGLFVTFVAGLSLGLLGYYRAVSSTLGILFVLIVLDRLTEWDLRDEHSETANVE